MADLRKPWACAIANRIVARIVVSAMSTGCSRRPQTSSVAQTRRKENLPAPVVRGGRLSIWWRRGGSNSRHPRCKRGALPTELRPQIQRRLTSRVSDIPVLLPFGTLSLAAALGIASLSAAVPARGNGVVDTISTHAERSVKASGRRSQNKFKKARGDELFLRRDPWWAILGSNQGPHAYQACALTN